MKYAIAADKFGEMTYRLKELSSNGNTWVGPLREDFMRFDNEAAATAFVVDHDIKVAGREIIVQPVG